MMAALLLALVAAQAAAPAAESADTYIQRAAAFVQKHDYAHAIPELRQALKLSPDSKPANAMLGEALLAEDYPGESIPYLQRGERMDLLGIALTEDHHTPEAIGVLLTALQKDPRNPDLLFYLGKACGFLSKSSFDRLIQVAPGSARAHQLMGESYQAQQQFGPAEEEFRKALALQPDLAGVHLALGLIKLEAGHVEEAEKEFRAEANLSPGNGEAAWRLGNVLLKEGHPQEAIAELKRADELRPQMVETLYDLGKAYSLVNEPAKAEKAWLQVIDLNDSSDQAASAHLALSELYRKQGRTAEANQQLEKFRERQKGGPPN